MSVLNRLGRAFRPFMSPAKWDRKNFNDHAKESHKPFAYFKGRILHPKAKAAYLCTLVGVGSYVYVKTRKETACKDNIILHENNQYEKAINKSRNVMHRLKDELGIPGIVVGVSVDGKAVWKEGFGYADIENQVPCSSDTVMPIASISKSVTMAVVGKLWEENKLDLDKPVQEYVPYFPTKTFDGEPVTLTCRDLVSHLGGIRHYEKTVLIKDKDEDKDKDDKDNKNEELKYSNKNGYNRNDDMEYDMDEFLLKERFLDVKSAIDLFKDDPLLVKPGTKFHYSTHGWTLISAIVEGITKEQFPVHMKKFFKQLGMSHTFRDVYEDLIYDRSRSYERIEGRHLLNARYVDVSYKWAGGGFLSTVGDLLQFGNAMLHSFQHHSLGTQSQASSKEENSACEKGGVKIDQQSPKMLPGYLSAETMAKMWSPIANVEGDLWYGMGWVLVPEKQDCQFCEKKRFYVYHPGGGIGSSSVLLILPEMCESDNSVECRLSNPPKGIVVSILTNLDNISLVEASHEIATVFDGDSN